MQRESKCPEWGLPRPEVWACSTIEVMRETPEVKQEQARGRAEGEPWEA